VRVLLAMAVGETGGGVLLILENERAQARAVVLRHAYRVQTAVLSPARAGLQTAILSSRGGRIRLSVPQNSVLAVSTVP
jgi:hypothetical protein